MNKKRLIIIILILVTLGCIGGGLYYYFGVQDKDSTLTVAEKQWIEDNKNNIIDLSIPTNVPIFSYEGEGLFFDFIKSIEGATGLEFNQLSYNLSSTPTSDYAFVRTSKVEDNDILIYEDNYVILTRESKKYVNLSDLNVMTVGVLDTNLDVASSYLKANAGISFQAFKDQASLLTALSTSKIGAIILPKTLYIDDIIAKDDLNIAYNISEMTESFVLRMGDNKRLNTILKKYYAKWNKEKKEEVFNHYFAENYFAFKEIYENEKVKFRSKRYTYGFIPNAPYDKVSDGNLVGINSEIIKAFSRLADVEVSFSEYKNVAGLINAFNENKVDFFLNTSSNENYAMDVVATSDVLKDEVVIASSITNNITINSVSSLISKSVLTIEDTLIDASLENYDISVKAYANIEDLLKHIDNDSILVIDKRTFDVYSKTSLKDFKVDYHYFLDSAYRYVSRDIEDNKTFNNFLSFYVSFIDDNYYINKVSYKDFVKESDSLFAIYASIGLLILGLVGILILMTRKNNYKKSKKVSKEEKLKYIDQLTSLKNRNFLNDSISKWDESEVYPQTIVIVDLNNIAYINDNYGHEEGDKVIIESANILINNQLENSEIIRTDGNEFLIYLVAYDEKQIVAYIRKLTKELKEISHGFGAAVGYSMIQDGIKTIDDAINEATLDMKTNKEEIQE